MDWYQYWYSKFINHSLARKLWMLSLNLVLVGSNFFTDTFKFFSSTFLRMFYLSPLSYLDYFALVISILGNQTLTHLFMRYYRHDSNLTISLMTWIWYHMLMVRNDILSPHGIILMTSLCWYDNSRMYVKGRATTLFFINDYRCVLSTMIYYWRNL